MRRLKGPDAEDRRAITGGIGMILLSATFVAAVTIGTLSPGVTVAVMAAGLVLTALGVSDTRSEETADSRMQDASDAVACLMLVAVAVTLSRAGEGYVALALALAAFVLALSMALGQFGDPPRRRDR